MGLKKTAVFAILMALFVYGIIAKPLKKESEKEEQDCTKLFETIMKLIDTSKGT